MFRHNFCLYLLLFSPAILLAQGRISGKVTDNKKHALPGVNVFIKGTYDGATTAADGSFYRDNPDYLRRNSLVVVSPKLKRCWNWHWKSMQPLNQTALLHHIGEKAIPVSCWQKPNNI